MPIRLASSKPIWEVASLLSIFILVGLDFVVLLNWLPLMLRHAGWGSRPFPPYPAEAILAECQDSTTVTVFLVLLLCSIALRLAWLRAGRKYEWGWAGGRTVFDHLVLTFVAGILIANIGEKWKFPLEALLQTGCGAVSAAPPYK